MPQAVKSPPISMAETPFHRYSGHANLSVAPTSTRDVASLDARAHSAPVSVADDSAWAERIRHGDAAAFDALFRTHAAALAGFAYQFVRSEAVAEELVQEVFLRIWRSRERWVLHGSMRRYLFVAVRHVALNHLRHERVERRWFTGMAQEQARGAGAPGTLRKTDAADERLYANELAAAVEAAVARLPKRCRLIYTLVKDQHLSYGEAAEVLSLSEKTVENQIGIALKSLRKQVAHLLK